ncbi:NlpC/P60 family protein [Corynebacterium capitovis]|uniref:C40 family peptidase n=1 Tax=Corynebacterium capitovis TaxID=131081 RepID=UPI0003634D78
MVAGAPFPLFNAVAGLAHIVSADPARMQDAVAALYSDQSAVETAAREGAALIAAAGDDLTRLTLSFYAEASTLVPLVLNPLSGGPAAARLAHLTVSAFTRAESRLAQLERDLEPHVALLSKTVSDAAARPPLNPSDTAVRATRELERYSAPESDEPVPAVFEAASLPVPAGGGNQENSEVGRAAVEAAKTQLGAPYAWGGTGPEGFDCSGLTSWAYRQAGVELPRMAHEQAIGQQVTYDQLQPGDLAVWDGHVAMYAGDGMYIEAGDPVQLNPVRTENIGMGFRGFWRPTA